MKAESLGLDFPHSGTCLFQQAFLQVFRTRLRRPVPARFWGRFRAAPEAGLIFVGMYKEEIQEVYSEIF